MLNLNFNTDDFLTMEQGDKRYLKRYAQIPGMEEITDQITNINTQLTTISYNTGIMNLNLFQPLLNSGDTSINNLSGLSSYVNSKITSNSYVTGLGAWTTKHENELYNPLKYDDQTYPQQAMQLSGLTNLVNNMISSTTSISNFNNFALDPFMAVVNLNTDLTTTQFLSFANMPQNSINYNTALSTLKNLRFGKIEMHAIPSSDTSLNVQDWVPRLERFYNFYLNLEDLKTINNTSLGIAIFVPDSVFNVYDKRIYKLHTIYNDDASVNFNNLNLGLMHLYFRNHVKFWYETLQHAFGIGTGRFAELKLYLAFLSEIHLYGYSNILNPNTKVRVTFCRISNSHIFKALGLYHLMYIPLMRNQAPIYNFAKLHVIDGTTKYINEIKFPDSSILTFGGYYGTTWTEHTADYATYTTTSAAPTYFAESDEVSTYYDYLNKLIVW